jgi:hypothetical protein
MVLPNFCPTLIEISFSIPRERAYSKVVYDFDSVVTTYQVVDICKKLTGLNILKIQMM